jgi:hypothetical protein
MNRASSDASTKRRSNLRGFYEATLNERSGVAAFSLSRRIMAPFAANGKVTRTRACFSCHFAGETLASRLLNSHSRESAP